MFRASLRGSYRSCVQFSSLEGLTRRSIPPLRVKDRLISSNSRVDCSPVSTSSTYTRRGITLCGSNPRSKYRRPSCVRRSPICMAAVTPLRPGGTSLVGRLEIGRDHSDEISRARRRQSRMHCSTRFEARAPWADGAAWTTSETLTTTAARRSFLRCVWPLTGAAITASAARRR